MGEQRLSRMETKSWPIQGCRRIAGCAWSATGGQPSRHGAEPGATGSLAFDNTLDGLGVALVEQAQGSAHVRGRVASESTSLTDVEARELLSFDTLQLAATSAGHDPASSVHCRMRVIAIVRWNMTQLPGFSAVSPLELPRGLGLNRFRLICPGTHRMTRFPRPDSREARFNLERSIGQVIFQKGDFGYIAPRVSIPESTMIDFGCDFDRQLHLFDLRSCMSEHASNEKLNVRFGFGGELNITGLTGDVEIDGLRVQRRLRLRVVENDSADHGSWIVGRHDTHYLVSGSLIDFETRSRAIGEVAERRAGTGPPRGEVVSVSDERLTLRARNEEIAVEPSNYTLTVRSSYIRRYHRPDTLAKLQVISGSLTPTGQRNRYAVKDRYKALVDSMEQFGWIIAMPADRQATIERAWTEVRIQAGSA